VLHTAQPSPSVQHGSHTHGAGASHGGRRGVAAAAAAAAAGDNRARASGLTASGKLLDAFTAVGKQYQSSSDCGKQLCVNRHVPHVSPSVDAATTPSTTAVRTARISSPVNLCRWLCGDSTTRRLVRESSCLGSSTLFSRSESRAVRHPPLYASWAIPRLCFYSSYLFARGNGCPCTADCVGRDGVSAGSRACDGLRLCGVATCNAQVAVWTLAIFASSAVEQDYLTREQVCCLTCVLSSSAVACRFLGLFGQHGPAAVLWTCRHTAAPRSLLSHTLLRSAQWYSLLANALCSSCAPLCYAVLCLRVPALLCPIDLNAIAATVTAASPCPTLMLCVASAAARGGRAAMSPVVCRCWSLTSDDASTGHWC
jgi:hypothetical protein